MKFKLHGGADIELLTQSELRDELKAFAESWRNEAGRGIKFRLITGAGVTAGGAGAFQIGGGVNNNRDQLGPEPGFIWSVTRVAFAGNGFVPGGANVAALYIDDINPSKIVQSAINNVATFDPGVLILGGGQRLAATGTGQITDGLDVVLSGGAIELPEYMRARFL